MTKHLEPLTRVSDEDVKSRGTGSGSGLDENNAELNMRSFGEIAVEAALHLKLRCACGAIITVIAISLIEAQETWLSASARICAGLALVGRSLIPTANIPWIGRQGSARPHCRKMSGTGCMHDPFARHGNIFRSDKIALPGWEAGREIPKPMHEEKSLTIARAFAGAASYDEHAMVQRSVATELARTISLLSIPADARILEIGCGTGFLGEALIRHLPSAHWLMTDLTREMLIRAEKRLAGSADIQFSLMDGQMPDLDCRFDLICSSLAFQWFSDLPLALDRLSRLLPKGGRLAFTTLAQGCFSEWRDAHLGEACGLADYPSAEALRSLGLEVTALVPMYPGPAIALPAPPGSS
ncbi:hypothetical protein E4T56_gene10357 [Termitomyces sp. T112]|nr:hypothetical protein E4T56_gene10357 [Termitomyces sp. T112]